MTIKMIPNFLFRQLEIKPMQKAQLTIKILVGMAFGQVPLRLLRMDG